MRKFGDRFSVLAVLSLLLPVFAQTPNSNPPAELGGRPRGTVGDIPLAASSASTPRLPDGTVNLGRVPGEKGIWGLTANSNFAQFSLDAPRGWTGSPQRGGA